MLRSPIKVAAAFGIAIAALATPAAAQGTAGTAGAAPADAAKPLDAAAAAYLRVYPGLSADAARTAAAQQESRKSLYARLTADGGKTFAGAWFDARSGVLHVAATTAAARTDATTQAARLGLTVQTHAVSRSLADLEKQAALLRSGRTALGRAARGQVGLDVQANRVVVAVPRQRVAALSSGNSAAVRVVADPKVKTQEDAGCTSRAECDWTVRAGAILWAGSAPNKVCSVGFTARTTANQRYVYTAGHCSSGNGVTWGTGQQYIGAMVASVNTGPYDAAIIRVDNPWFRYDTGGEAYNEYTTGRTVNVNGVAPTLGYIWAGDTVCLSANYPAPNGPNYCGVVGTNSDSAVRGMVRVDGLDACPGDSGGGWYWLTSTGRRIAYGVHSRSDSGCHGSEGGSHSWFSPLPTIKSGWTPWLDVEVRP